MQGKPSGSSFEEFATFGAYDELNIIISIAAIVVFFVEFLFVFNFLYSIKYGEKISFR